MAGHVFFKNNLRLLRFVPQYITCMYLWKLALTVFNSNDRYLLINIFLFIAIGLWGLVNNAGILDGLALLEITPLADVERHVDVNLYGMIRVTTAFLPLVRKSRGRIVNISSMCGRCAMGQLPYTVSKYGVEAFSDILRHELYCTGISVHILEPGNFKTGIFSAERANNYLMTLFKQANKEVQEYYGQECIDKIAKTLSEYEENNSSPHLWKVVDAYTHALTAKYPKCRYVIGVDAYFVAKVLGYLPEWLQDYIMFKVAPIIPAKCKR